MTGTRSGRTSQGIQRDPFIQGGRTVAYQPLVKSSISETESDTEKHMRQAYAMAAHLRTILNAPSENSI